MNNLLPPRVQQLQHLLFSSGGHAYAVLDAARSPNLLRWVERCGLQSRSLYSGTAAITLAEQAPCLVQLAPDGPALEHLLRSGWGQSLGIFVSSWAGFDELRIALKKKLVVRGADGRRRYFRFYDPRVARAFLATADTAGVRWWFEGPIERYVMETADANALEMHRRAAAGNGNGLRQIEIAAADALPEAA